MASKLLPEYWVSGFIKSATNGRTVTVKQRRLITLLAIPIWVIGLIVTIVLVYQAIAAWPHYIQAKSYYDLYQSDYYNYFNLRYTVYAGAISLVLYLFICFIAPWTLLRLASWIKDADNVKE
ncbi:MAG: hypothetical protein ACTHMD_10980 [Flavisolibacter sp.]